MAKIAINLLPLEFRAQDLKNTRFYKIQIAGIAVILLMIFLSSLIVTLRVLQSKKLSQLQDNLIASEQRISNLQDTQSSLLLLKNRLTTINENIDNPSKQAQTYLLINKLLPKTVTLSSISVSKSGEVLAQAFVPDVNSLDDLISNLISRETNEDKISQVSLESINRGRDGIYRLSLKIKPN